MLLLTLEDSKVKSPFECLFGGLFRLVLDFYLLPFSIVFYILLECWFKLWFYQWFNRIINMKYKQKRTFLLDN